MANLVDIGTEASNSIAVSFSETQQDVEASVDEKLQPQVQVDTASVPASKKPRLYYIDSLRTWLTLLVVIHHCFWVVIAGWYPFIRPWIVDVPTLVLGYMILSGDQAYFMGLFFFLAGLVTTPSLKRKGPWVFLKDRIYRLVLPAVLYDLIFFPLLITFVNATWGLTGEDPTEGSTNSYPPSEVWARYFKNLGATMFIMNQMWFTVTLFVLSLVAVVFIHSVEAWKTFVFNQHPIQSISQKSMLLLLVKLSSILVVLNYLLRIPFPNGYPWYPFVGNLGFIMQYIVAFTCGILANSYQFLDHVRIAHLRITLSLGIMFYFMFQTFQTYLFEILRSSLGFYLHTFLVTLFEQFFAVFWSYSLLGYFKEYHNVKPSQFFSRLIGSAYATYIAHQWIIIPIAVGLAYTSLYPIIVILILLAVSPPLAWSAGLLLKAIPGSDKIL
jgi:glucan biosynthesis protein C